MSSSLRLAKPHQQLLFRRRNKLDSIDLQYVHALNEVLIIHRSSQSMCAIQGAESFAAKMSLCAAQTDADAQFADVTWPAFLASGVAVCPLPVEFGGSGLWQANLGSEQCAVLRLLGAADLSVARLFEGHLNAIGLVCRYGTPGQIEELARDVARGALSAVWGAEDATGLKLVSSSKSSVLQGRKILASGAGFVTRPLVTAEGTQGQQMCLLRLDPGYAHDISGWQVQGMRATATGTVDLSSMQVSINELVGSAGDYMRQPTFSGGAWRFCAVHVGAVERLVDLFRDHLVATKRGADAYQLQRLAVCVSAARTARFWVEEAARRLAGNGDADGIVAFSHLTRLTVERSALTVMETVQRGIGLRAFVRPGDVERICRDLSTYLRQPAPDLAMSDGARTFLHSGRSVGDF